MPNIKSVLQTNASLNIHCALFKSTVKFSKEILYMFVIIQAIKLSTYNLITIKNKSLPVCNDRECYIVLQYNYESVNFIKLIFSVIEARVQKSLHSEA